MQMKKDVRRDVEGMSGLCASGAGHHLCRGQWDTPSCNVTCGCKCHKKMVAKKITPKISGKMQAKVLVPKK